MFCMRHPYAKNTLVEYFVVFIALAPSFSRFCLLRFRGLAHVTDSCGPKCPVRCL